MVGDPVSAPGLDVLVQAVPRDVELPVLEPRAVGRGPLEALGRLLEPADELAREPRPEALEILLGLAVDRLVGHDRAFAEARRRRERSLLVEQRLDGGLGGLGPHEGQG